MHIFFIIFIFSSTRKFLKSYSRTCDSSLRRRSSSSTVWTRGALIECGHRGTHRNASASQGSSRCYLSCDGGARRREGTESCLVSLTKCCGRVWWCRPSCRDSPTTSYAAYYSCLWKHTNHIFSHLYIYFLSLSQF